MSVVLTDDHAAVHLLRSKLADNEMETCRVEHDLSEAELAASKLRGRLGFLSSERGELAAAFGMLTGG